MPARGLPIVDTNASLQRDRQDGVVLLTAQKLVDQGLAKEARAALKPLAELPHSAIRGQACLLYAGLSLMAGDAQAAVDALAHLPAQPPFSLDEGYRKMIEASALRQLRRYADALAAAEASIACGESSGRMMVLADAQKHAGRVDAAAATLRKLVVKEPRNATALAQLAGYDNLLGDVAAGAAVFAAFRAVAEPCADTERNAAFYFATKNDKDATLDALRRALAVEPAETASYIDDEVELDRFRTDPAFLALR